MEDSFQPETQPEGNLSPPPRKPPTAVAAAAPNPSPGEKPLAVRAWRRRPPTAIASAVTTLFDVLDLLGDAIAEKAGLRSHT